MKDPNYIYYIDHRHGQFEPFLRLQPTQGHLMERILEPDSQRRITIEEMKTDLFFQTICVCDDNNVDSGGRRHHHFTYEYEIAHKSKSLDHLHTASSYSSSRARTAPRPSCQATSATVVEVFAATVTSLQHSESTASHPPLSESTASHSPHHDIDASPSQPRDIPEHQSHPIELLGCASSSASNVGVPIEILNSETSTPPALFASTVTYVVTPSTKEQPHPPHDASQ